MITTLMTPVHPVERINEIRKHRPPLPYQWMVEVVLANAWGQR